MDSEVELLCSRADSLAAEFKQGGTSCIDEAVDLDRETLELFPPSHPKRSIFLSSFATRLSDRYDQLEATRDLEEAIVLNRKALDLRPKGHPDRSISLNGLAFHLSTRYMQLGVMEDLNETIILSREVLDLRPRGHPNRSMSLDNLAAYLFTRYRQLGAIEDLDEAIVLEREALDVCVQEYPNRWMSLNNLASCLSTRYDQLGVMEDLDEAILLNQEALDLCPQGNLSRPVSLKNLALCLSTRHKQLGVMADLDAAIILYRETLDLCPKGHPDRSILLNNLAFCLSARYIQLGVMEDLDEAIILNQEVLDLHPQGHPDRWLSLTNLAFCLSTRYKKHEDLDEVIVLSREALDLRPKGHPDRLASLGSIAFCLFARYNRLGVMVDLDEAIVLAQESLDHGPQGHRDRSMSLNNLAVCLSARYTQLGVMEDLDKAIVLAREALDLYPQAHRHRSTSLNNLARYLCDRFTRARQSEDKEELFSRYAQLAHVTQIVSLGDLYAARGWIHVAEDFQHPTILLAYETFLRLLTQHRATLPSLPQHLVILKNLTSSFSLDAFSACLRNHSPAKAVEFLEQGRGVFWSQLTRLRSPLDDVIAYGVTGKKLADEFALLTSLIRNALDLPSADQHERLCHLNLEVERVVNKIRELPGLSRFLLPPLFADLQHAASGGPVIIVNASKYSCDALVILLDRDPVHIPLQIAQESVRDLSTELHTLGMRAMRADATRELAAFLRKLWDQFVSTIVDSLRAIHPSQSRIWWCPTAEFATLPLHAAGPYRKGQPNLPDIYISSYTPTLDALIRARRHDPSSPTTVLKRFVAIGQARAAGENELPSVGVELDNIGRVVRDLATFTRIDGAESCISRVVGELDKNEWVHLACHGLPNRIQPFESAFALYDGHFTIQRIIGCDLKGPEFAYLSACHTTVGDEESPDEVIYLASAMQFIGFRSVIGTMWAVDDSETNKITSTFYKHMVNESGRLDYTRAAFALNKTMWSVHIPLDQRILYIHLGA
ncbi:CHAT domain-containing protein [Boletus edulis BED1]|uniref:CHAT domain-containing protein n=1 Tax=Boletus edulis BED1 TaxID=1328754 RepID=A0AAD4BS44_BOLED|nr:CHAT domain-containing protein [Boletus edulis BED1]